MWTNATNAEGSSWTPASSGPCGKGWNGSRRGSQDGTLEKGFEGGRTFPGEILLIKAAPPPRHMLFEVIIAGYQDSNGKHRRVEVLIHKAAAVDWDLHEGSEVLLVLSTKNPTKARIKLQ